MASARLTVPALVARRAAQDPHLRFVVTETDAATYDELDRTSLHAAAHLVRSGARKGTRVGLLMENGIDWAVVAIAAMRMGCVLVPLSTLLRPPELEAHLRAAGVELLVAVEGFRGRDYVADLGEVGLVPGPDAVRAPHVPRLRSILVWGAWPSPPDPDDEELGVVRALGSTVRPADDMAIIFTSGSQGAPKPVVHTHGGALGATASGLHARCLEPGDRLYIPMPFFWTGGFSGGLITVLVAGATLVTEAEPSPAATLRLLERERVTLFRGWPDQAASLAADPAFADADLSSLRPGSLDPILPPALRAAPGARPVLFGMTETFGPYCADRLDGELPPDKHGALGRPFDGIEVSIRDPGTGEPLPPGSIGEIHVRGPNVMRGICGRTRAETFTPDGAYPTGDLGWLDEDGYLFSAGRLDDMIKVRGATVYPSEVEAALGSLPGVSRAIVVDVGSGASVGLAAAVVPTQPGGVTPSELRRQARRSLSAFKVPSRWAVLDDRDIPRTATGKVDKARLRSLLETSEA